MKDWYDSFTEKGKQAYNRAVNDPWGAIKVFEYWTDKDLVTASNVWARDQVDRPAFWTLFFEIAPTSMLNSAEDKWRKQATRYRGFVKPSATRGFYDNAVGFNGWNRNDKYESIRDSVTPEDFDRLLEKYDAMSDDEFMAVGMNIERVLEDRGLLKATNQPNGAAAAGALAAAATAAATGGLVGGGRMTMNRLLLALAVGVLVYFLFRPKGGCGCPTDRDRRPLV